MSWWIYSCTTHIININQAGVGYYLHREGSNLGKNIVSLVSCYHPALTHSSGPLTRDPPVLTPTLVLSLRVPLCPRNQEGCLLPSLKTVPLLREPWLSAKLSG